MGNICGSKSDEHFDRSEFVNMTLGHRYKIGKLLGAGHFSEVREGYDLQMKERVAIKLMKEGSDGCDDINMSDELRALKTIKHKHVI